MSSNNPNFSISTKWEALSRQGDKCACCGTKISVLGFADRENHEYGEHNEAHHMMHKKMIRQGISPELLSHVNNCVILCYACHLNAHEGGRFKGGDSYLMTKPKDWPFFLEKGKRK